MKILFIIFAFSLSSSCFAQQVSYQTVKIQDMGFIVIPSSMEVQTGLYREIAQQYLANVGIYSHEIVGDRIVFQQKGLNIGQGRETYARVIIRSFKGRRNEYPKIDSRQMMTNRELLEYGEAFKADTFRDPRVKLTNWYGVENVMLNGKYNGIKISYSRQIGNNPPVFTVMYQINNNDRLHGLTFSYRESDSRYWEPIMLRVIESVIINPR